MKISAARSATYAGIALLSVFGLILVARTWLQTLFEGLGPARTADLALIVAATACGASLFVLGAFLAAGTALIRLERERETPAAASLIDVAPARRTITRLPSGNWAGDPNIAQTRLPKDVIELAFSGRPAVAVPRSAFYDALRMPRLRRADWRHDANAYAAIRAYLMERGAVDNKGIWNSERREAIRRMAE